MEGTVQEVGRGQGFNVVINEGDGSVFGEGCGGGGGEGGRRERGPRPI